MEELLEMVAKFIKFTPKKKRYNAEMDGVSVSIYVSKDRPTPAKIVILMEEGL